MVTYWGEFRAAGAAIVMVPVSRIPLTVTTFCSPPPSVPLGGLKVYFVPLAVALHEKGSPPLLAMVKDHWAARQMANCLEVG
jgi:hypothetical protein